MARTSNFARKILCGSSALRALALMGAGVGVLSSAAPALAQDYSQVAATGRVQGTNGQPIAGATVTITSNDQGFTRTATTDGSGTFRVPALPQGTYTFSIAAEGYDAFTDSGVALSQSGSANQFTLAAAGASQGGEIVVTAGRVQTVDFNRNTTGAVIDIGSLATRVPVARDVTSVVLLSPGTSGGDTAFGNLPSINGSSVSENVYYLNGLNITQFRNGLGAVTVPFEMYQTIDIKNGGIPAEFGRTTGGVINATTKSGSNEFHGGVTFNWEPNSLRNQSPNTYLRDNDSRYDERKDFIAQLSGPIIKDHLFFYGIYNSRDVQTGGGFTTTADALDPRRVPGTGAVRTRTQAQLDNSCFINPSKCVVFDDLAASNLNLVGQQYIQDRSTKPFYGGKIDAVIVDGQRLEATYFNTTSSTIRNVYGTSIYSLASGDRYNPNTNAPGRYASSTVFRSGGENYVFRYTGTFTDWLTLSAAYGVNKNQDTTESNRPDYSSVLDQRNGNNASIGNTTTNSSFNFDKRTFYRADADVYFKLLGSHHIRGGYDREDLDERSVTTANGGYQYTLATAAGSAATGNVDTALTGLPTGTNYVKARTFISGGQFTTKNDAFYIQDSWSLFSDRLQLNLGVRDDRFVSENVDGVAFFKSGDNFAPRLGFSFDPVGSGRSKIYGSFSRYFLPVAVNTNIRLAGSELDYDAYSLFNGISPDNTPILGGGPVTTGAGFVNCPAGSPVTGRACVIRNDGSTPGTESTVASNLKAQSTDEYIIGGEQRFGTRMRVGLFLTYSKLRNSLEDVSLDDGIRAYCVANNIQQTNANETGCFDVFNGVHQYALVNPGRDVSVTLSDPLPTGNGTALEGTNRTVTLSADSLGYPLAKRSYKAATITFDRDFDGKWELHANYTYSKNKGNIEGGIRSDNGQTDSGLTTAFDLPALVNGAYGYLPNDRRHNAKFYGSYQLTDWFNLGANFSLTSQRRFGCFGTAPTSADNGVSNQNYGANAFYCNVVNGNIVRNPVTSAPGAFPVTSFPVVNNGTNDTLQLVDRGSVFKSDWLYQLNLDATVKLPTDLFDGNLRFSVFNVLNSKSEQDFQEFGTVDSGAPSPLYRRTTAYQTPRYVRVQLNVGF